MTAEPLELALTASPTDADVAAIVAGLDDARPDSLPPFRPEPLAVLLRDRTGWLWGASRVTRSGAGLRSSIFGSSRIGVVGAMGEG